MLFINVNISFHFISNLFHVGGQMVKLQEILYKINITTPSSSVGIEEYLLCPHMQLSEMCTFVFSSSFWGKTIWIYFLWNFFSINGQFIFFTLLVFKLCRKQFSQKLEWHHLQVLKFQSLLVQLDTCYKFQIIGQKPFLVCLRFERIFFLAT